MYRKNPENTAKIRPKVAFDTEKNKVEVIPKIGAIASTRSHLKASFFVPEFFIIKFTVFDVCEKEGNIFYISYMLIFCDCVRIIKLKAIGEMVGVGNYY